MTDLPNISLTLYAQTDVGMVRSGNEDNFLILDLTTGASWTASEPSLDPPLNFAQGYYGSLLAVSDGMGGALAGEVASRLAVETVRDRMLQLQAHRVYSQIPFPERLRLAIEEANLLINGESSSNPDHKGLGATFTAAAIQGPRVFFAQVGDSRAYLMRSGKIIRITKDQSLVQQLIDAGQITEEEAETHSYRNVILQALGAHGNVNVEVNALKLCQGDMLVLCSDGLSGKVRADEIARIVQATSDLPSTCRSLIALANERGGEDNITVVIAQFSGSGLLTQSDDTIEPEILARLPETPSELDWDLTSDTEPLGEPLKTEPLKEPAPPGSTEPLPPPPTSVLTSASRPRSQTSVNSPRTSETGRRSEPITSVFAPEDFDQDQHVKASFSSQPSLAALDESTGGGADSSSPLRDETTAPESRRRRSNGTLSGPTIMIALIAVIGLLGAGAWYVYQQRQERAREAQAAAEAKLRRETEQNDRRQELLDSVQRLLVNVNQKLLATETTVKKERLDKLTDRLREVEQKFESIKTRPADQLAEIEDDCRRIEEKIGELEKDLDDLRTSLAPPLSELLPASC